VDADVKGAAICKVLAERGARVAVNYSASPDRAEETRASLAGQGHVIIQGDVFTHEGVDALVAGTIKALGGIDFIVSNAGWTKFGPYSDISESGDTRICTTERANTPYRGDRRRGLGPLLAPQRHGPPLARPGRRGGAEEEPRLARHFRFRCRSPPVWL
jgi:NAD(P)-dependent dehydrogenase (short-subunit alcohol dehydrogenase family)